MAVNRQLAPTQRLWSPDFGLDTRHEPIRTLRRVLAACEIDDRSTWTGGFGV